MDFKWGDSTWGLMLVRRPSGTHLSRSSTPGGKSPLARDDNNALVTQAVLFAGGKAALCLVGAGMALGAAAPRVKSGLIGLKSKLGRQAEKTVDVETPVPLTLVAGADPQQSDAPQLRAVCHCPSSGRPAAADTKLIGGGRFEALG